MQGQYLEDRVLDSNREGERCAQPFPSTLRDPEFLPPYAKVKQMQEEHHPRCARW